MPADLNPLIEEVKAIETVVESATAFVNGEAARIQAAVTAALANGATAEQLAPVQAEVDALKAKAADMAAAIAAVPA